MVAGVLLLMLRCIHVSTFQTLTCSPLSILPGQVYIFQLLAAILHLGNVTFVEDSSGDGCVVDNTTALLIASSLLQVCGALIVLCGTALNNLVIVYAWAILRRL